MRGSTLASFFASWLWFVFEQAEEKKREENESRRQENQLAFKAWLLKKRDQLQEEKRIHRAQEMERSNCKVRPPGGTFT